MLAMTKKTGISGEDAVEKTLKELQMMFSVSDN